MKALKIKNKHNEITTVKELFDKKLKKRSDAIYWSNITIFVVMCLAVFIFIISPLIIWMFGYDFGGPQFYSHFKIALAIGIPVLLISVLYGILVFWELMIKYTNFTYKKHDIYLYMGVEVVVLAIDNKVIACCKDNYFSTPNTTWWVRLEQAEFIRFETIRKHKYELDFNWYTDSSIERDLYFYPEGKGKDD